MRASISVLDKEDTVMAYRVRLDQSSPKSSVCVYRVTDIGTFQNRPT